MDCLHVESLFPPSEHEHTQSSRPESTSDYNLCEMCLYGVTDLRETEKAKVTAE